MRKFMTKGTCRHSLDIISLEIVEQLVAYVSWRQHCSTYNLRKKSSFSVLICPFVYNQNMQVKFEEQVQVQNQVFDR